MSDTHSVIIYHNPRCSKSRQTLGLLQENGVEPEIVEYLKTPPTQTELNEILKKLGKEPREIMRTGEKEYKALGLKDADLSRKELIKIMVENPRLIERPIVLKSGKAALGRPPEDVLEII
ncbi:MAG: arsenate reductase (glutaredoxin) [Thiothrix sp.]|nr:MAG: arsenate reductase (glutaredoxin) [Thiothrix sp.]